MSTATLGVGVPHTFQWEDLPTVIADLIVQALARQLRDDVWGVSTTHYDEVRDAMHRARLVSHAFADAVGYLWKLTPPMVWVPLPLPPPPPAAATWQQKGYYSLRGSCAPGFVEGVMRLTIDAQAGRAVLSTATYCMVYNMIYLSATAPRPYNGAEQLHDAVGTVASALAAEGAFQQLDTAAKRDNFVKFFGRTFKYIDKFYGTRLMLRGTEEILREALVSG